MAWFAVRHVIKNADAYEERITVWDSESAEEAIARADVEASEYAWEGTEPLALYQSFELDGAPRDGAEVFSLIRRSDLSASEYLDSFFTTGSELEQITES
jgi:hypothetical protein